MPLMHAANSKDALLRVFNHVVTATVSKQFVKMLGRRNMCAIFSIKGGMINVSVLFLMHSLYHAPLDFSFSIYNRVN